MKNKGNVIFASVLIAIVVVAIGFMVIANQNGSKQVKDEKGQAVDYSKIDLKNQPMLGKEDAPVTLVEFGDYKCPACRFFETDIMPNIEKKYIESGKVKMYFINTPFHGKESMLGAQAGEILTKEQPEKFWDFHHELFIAQPTDEKSMEDVWLTSDKVKEVAKKAGVTNVDALINDLSGDKSVDAVKKDIEIVNEYGINGTPTVLVNGKMANEPWKPGELEKDIDNALKDTK